MADKSFLTKGLTRPFTEERARSLEATRPGMASWALPDLGQNLSRVYQLGPPAS